jgi:putative ABC transport system ATP-binding protein
VDEVCGFRLERVTVVRGAAPILEEVSAVVPAGRCTAVVGPSGAGKSTLLRLLNRLVEPTAGRVLLDQTPLPELDVLALRRRVGLVAQHPVLLTDRVDTDLRLGRPDLTDQQITDLLTRVGLPATFGQRPTEGLSGGEAQRVCLARALSVRPQVLLLDEPTSALDGDNVAVIVELARDHLAGGGVVLVSHDLTVVRGIAEHVLVLDRGHLAAAGHPAEIDYLQTR